MVEKDFELEDKLQKLLEDYPDLLPGDQITPKRRAAGYWWRAR